MISVLFATHNGAATLPLMLRSLLELSGNVDYEIVAVDNSSKDETPLILDIFKEILPLRVLQQPRRGKNPSLNLGLSACRGDLVVLTDDDVIVDPDWLSAFQACAEIHPDVDLFGGPIAAHWTTPPPQSLLDAVNTAMMFGITPSETKDGPVSPLNIWGANMMVRKRVFDDGHRFDETIGPSGGAYIMGSETEFNVRIQRSGYNNWFCSSALVSHIIREHQLTVEWVAQRAFRHGRSEYMHAAAKPVPVTEKVTTVLPVPRWIFRKICEHALFALGAKIRGDNVSYVRNRCDYMFYRGYLHQALQRGRRSG